MKSYQPEYNSFLLFSTGGFLYVDEILKHRKAKDWSVRDVERVVATNDKQRFHLEPHPDNGRLRIRANQGHSMAVGSTGGRNLLVEMGGVTENDSENRLFSMG